MGTSRRQREAAEAARRHRTQRLVWAATACVALIVVAATAAIVARSQTGVAPPPARTTSAADRNAPAALKRAAAAVGFHTTTEPGVGVLESEPASAARPSTNPDLLKPGTLAPAFTLKTPQGQTVSLSDFRGKPVLLELFATWCPHCQAEAPHLAKLATELQPEGRRVRLDQRRLRECGQRVRIPPLLRAAVPGTARPGHADRVVHATGRFRAGHVGVPPAVLPDVLRDIADRADHLRK